MRMKYEADSSRGPVKFAIADHDCNVIVFFEHAVTWFGLPITEARKFGEALIAHADRVEQINQRQRQIGDDHEATH